MIDTHCHINFFKNAGDVALNCEKRKVNTNLTEKTLFYGKITGR